MASARFEGRLARIEQRHSVSFLDTITIDQKRALLACLEALDAGDPEPADAVAVVDTIDPMRLNAWIADAETRAS
jgi:hypothetical protein